MGETLTIAPQHPTAKSRQFTVELICMITADGFWPGGTKHAYRPIYLAYAASDQTARAFTANLRTGRPADVRDAAGLKLPKQLEVPRSAGMKWQVRKLGGAGISLVTGWLPALCQLGPGLLPEDIRFLFAPPSWWVEHELEQPKIVALDQAVRRDAVLGGYLAAYLDARTVFPIVPDPLFHARLYRRLVAAKVVRWPAGAPYSPGPIWSLPSVDLLPSLAEVGFVYVKHKAFETILREVSRDYFSADAREWLRSIEDESEQPRQPAPTSAIEPPHPLEIPDVPTRIAGGGGLLPVADRPDPQRSLFDFV